MKKQIVSFKAAYQPTKQAGNNNVREQTKGKITKQKYKNYKYKLELHREHRQGYCHRTEATNIDKNCRKTKTCNRGGA